MAGVSSPRSLRDLFAQGTANGLTDPELLARFRSGADPAAFETLIARHGPMVWRICRDLLIDEHAAEDAFQATFLVLVRKAGSVRVDDSLGRWLYGVAWRVARHSRADRRKRQIREGGPPVDSSTGCPTDADRRELRAIVQHEVAQLPERFRAPIVLCHLEGLSHEEAARQLRCPVGTVRSRLARGRDRLRDRLARLGAPAVSVPLLEPLAVPARLLTATVQSAVGWETSSSLISASVISLTKGVIMAMTFAQIKAITTGLITVGLVAIAGSALVAHPGPVEAPSAALATETETETEAPGRLVPVPDTPPTTTRPADQPSATELAVRLQYAEERMRLTTQMHASGSLSAIEALKAREEVAVLRSQLDDQAEQLQEEIDSLGIEKRLRMIELDMAKVNVQLMDERADRLEKLREKAAATPGEVSEAIRKRDQAKLEQEMKSLQCMEVNLRAERAQKRLTKLRSVLGGKAPAAPPSDPGPGPGPGTQVPR